MSQHTLKLDLPVYFCRRLFKCRPRLLTIFKKKMKIWTKFYMFASKYSEQEIF